MARRVVQFQGTNVIILYVEVGWLIIANLPCQYDESDGRFRIGFGEYYGGGG